MIEKAKDGWRKPRSIYRSFFGSGVLTAGVIAVVCLLVVLVCHLFETPPPEVNALRYTTDTLQSADIYYEITSGGYRTHVRL
jgi:hypothetical protein